MLLIVPGACSERAPLCTIRMNTRRLHSKLLKNQKSFHRASACSDRSWLTELEASPFMSLPILPADLGRLPPADPVRPGPRGLRLPPSHHSPDPKIKRAAKGNAAASEQPCSAGAGGPFPRARRRGILSGRGAGRK